MNQVQLAAIAPAPWKNGGGQTRELLCRAGPGAAGWRWRISVADIARDGPFSSFPGLTRHFAVLAGAGVRLCWPDGRHATLGPADPPLCFDGAAAPECSLLDGPTRDLNVMVDSLRTQAQLLAAWPARPWQAQAALRAVFACRSVRLETGQGTTRHLSAGTLAWTEDDDATPWSLAADADSRTGPPAWWIALNDRPDSAGALP